MEARSVFQLLVDRSDRAPDILPPEEIQAEQMLAAGGIFPIGKQQDEEFLAPSVWRFKDLSDDPCPILSASLWESLTKWALNDITQISNFMCSCVSIMNEYFALLKVLTEQKMSNFRNHK